MIGCDLVRIVLVGAVAALLHAGHLGIAGLAVAAALVGLADAPFAAARNAIVPQVVAAEELLRATSILQVSFRSAYFVGPLVLGPLQSWLAMPGVFAVDAATFAVSALALAAMRVPALVAEDLALGLRADLAAGWRAARAAPEVLVVVSVFVLAIVLASGFLTVGVATLVGRRLGSAGDYGLLLGIAGLSEVGGALLLSRVRIRRLARTAVLAWALLGLFRLPLGLAGSVPVAAALLAATGFASAVTDIPLIALVQQRIPGRHLAKVLGAWEAGITGAVAVSPPLAAALIQLVGLGAGFALSGAALVLLGFAGALAVRRVEGPLAPAAAGGTEP